GVLLAMWHEPTAGTLAGQAAYGLAKVWILALPIVWLLAVERGRPSLSPARKGGYGVAAALGLAISAVIVGAYVLLGPSRIDPAMVREVAQSTGIAEPARYLFFALYIITFNAILEEYVWRWFVFRQCEKLFPEGGGVVAVLMSAGLFTLHHVFALAVQFSTL